MNIAIIGHGRSPEGMGWGKRINGCDFVVRMWNWHWQSKEDYGNRYDFGVLEAHSRVLEQWKQYNRRTPSKGWLGSLLMHGRDLAEKFPKGTVTVDQDDYMATLPEELRGCGETGNWQLTRGSVAACWAISTANYGDHIILVGFDVIRAGVAVPVSYAFSQKYLNSSGFYGMGSYKEGQTKEGSHDYPAERRLIMAMARQAGARVSFAQDIWPCSDRQKPEVKKGSGLMKFYYVGEYPAGGVAKCWGHEFRRGDAVELPDEFAAKARGNRFFVEVTGSPVDVPTAVEEEPTVNGMTKADLTALAEARGVRIDKRWNIEKIAAAIDVAAKALEGE